MIICDGIVHVADLVNDNLTESKVGRTKDSPTLSTDLFDLALLGIQSRRTTRYVLAPALQPLVNVLLVSLIPIASWFVFRLLLDPSPPLATLFSSVVFSIFAFLVVLYLIPSLVGPLGSIGVTCWTEQTLKCNGLLPNQEVHCS